LFGVGKGVGSFTVPSTSVHAREGKGEFARSRRGREGKRREIDASREELLREGPQRTSCREEHVVSTGSSWSGRDSN